MWERKRLKTEAKRILSINYWLPFAVSLVAGLLGAHGSSGGSAAGSNAGSTATEYYQQGANGFERFGEYYAEKVERFFENPAIAGVTVLLIVLLIVTAFVAAFAFQAFVSGPVEVGECRFYMENRSFPSRFGRLFWAFGNGSYLNCVKIQFFRALKTFLWSLLFIIPGIIKGYEYCMIPYILAENPHISSQRAFELSKKMTDGEKWRIFVLDLSFLGWYLLGTLACGVGVLFVNPYEHATRAELYQVMREKAYGMGFADGSDMPGFLPQQA